jgi:hypothetical protein
MVVGIGSPEANARISQAVGRTLRRDSNERPTMNTTHTLKRILAGALLSGGVAVAGLVLGAGAAQADPYNGPIWTWCPGQALPERFIQFQWDMNKCHNYFIVKMGTGNVGMVGLNGKPIDSWISADVPPPEMTRPPPPPPPPPGQPFCTPRGGLFIVGPICDEIGVGPPR